MCGAHTVLEVDSEQMTLSELFGRRVCQSIVWEVDLRTASSRGSKVCVFILFWKTEDLFQVV